MSHLGLTDIKGLKRTEGCKTTTRKRHIQFSCTTYFQVNCDSWSAVLIHQVLLVGSELHTVLTGFPFSPLSHLQPYSSHLQDSDGPSRQDSVQPPVFPALRQSRVVSSTSEEEEALTEKFLKINCKYITDGKVR